MIENLISGFAALGDPQILVMLILGNLLGFIFGMLPGLGVMQAMALALPLTFGMAPLKAMFLYAGIMGSSPLGGAVTAILIRIPGTPGNVCTTLEGYPMTERGEAARALTIAALASMIGELAGLVILVLMLPLAEQLILNLRAPEIFWVVMLGVTSIAFVGEGNFLKGLVAAAIGMLLSLVGTSPLFPMSRFDAGTYYLWDGVKLVPFFVGIFAIPQIVKLASAPQRDISKVRRQGFREIIESLKETCRYPVTLIRSILVGSVIGIIPGLGSSMANVIAYTSTVQLDRLRKDERPFGTGNTRALVASECSNNGKEGGALLTTLSFGIPGSAELALLLGALTLFGLEPGLNLVTEHVDLVWSLIIGLSVSQFISMAFVLAGTNWMSRIFSLKAEFITLPILLACIVGSYALDGNIWDPFLMMVAGFLSFGMALFGFPIISMAIGFVLAPTAERALGQSLQISLGDISILFTRPVSRIIILLVVLFMIAPLWGVFSRRRLRRHLKKHAGADQEAIKEPLPKTVDKGAVIFESGLLLAVAAFFYTSLQLGPGPGTVPSAASLGALIMLIVLIVAEFVPNIQQYFVTSAPDKPGVSEEEGGRPAGHDKKMALASSSSGMVALILILLPALYFFGFFMTVPFCFMIYLLIGRKVQWWSALVFALATWAVLYIVFDQLLQLSLWIGAGPELIDGWLGGAIAPRFF